MESTQKIIKNTPKQVFEKSDFWWAALAKGESLGLCQTSLYNFVLRLDLVSVGSNNVGGLDTLKSRGNTILPQTIPET